MKIKSANDFPAVAGKGGGGGKGMQAGMDPGLFLSETLEPNKNRTARPLIILRVLELISDVETREL